MSPDPVFTIGGPGRSLLGATLLALALGSLFAVHDLEFGIGWTGVVPAVLLCLPALALLRRRRIQVIPRGLRLEDGWLWRRQFDLPLTGGEELELVPTAGLRAVVFHRHQQEFIVATWLTGGQARRLTAWLDAQHPIGAWSRREPRKPAGDR